jgi:hypothetical protein
MLWTNLLTKTDFPLPVGPEITLAKRPDGRRGPESGQSVHQVFAPQELERHAHRSGPVQQK